MRGVCTVSDKLRFLGVMVLLLASMSAFAQTENCNNGIDDDGDGKIDLNDPDCTCNLSSIESIIPNPSFEERTGCPQGLSELYHAVPWQQATEATTDYINNCQYVPGAVINTEIEEFPDGDGIVGALFVPNWREYVGTNLSQHLLGGTHYQLTIDIAAASVNGWIDKVGTGLPDSFETMQVTLFGKTTSSSFPLPTMNSPDLYDANWIVLGYANYTPLRQWGQIHLGFTPPENISSIMIGPPTVLPPSYDFASSLLYVMYDNLRLNEASAFGVYIEQNGYFCEGNLTLQSVLTTTFSPAATYQWYKDGIAIIGATSPTLSVTDATGVYGLRIVDGSECYVTSTVVSDLLPSPEFTLDPPSCLSITGTITFETTGSSYSVDNGANWQTSPVFSGLAVGNYYLKVMTASGCISSVAGVLIAEPNLLPASGANVTQPDACGEKGSIEVQSTIADSYSFDNGTTWVTDGLAENLEPGTYNVRIKNMEGCISSALTVTIYPFYEGWPNFTYVNPDCPNKGKITITDTADWYSFDSGATWTTNPELTDLNSGSYTMMYKNDPDCLSHEVSVYLYPSALDPADYEVQHSSCLQPGRITFLTTADEYSFDDGLTWSASNVSGNLTIGYYNIKSRDASGCESTGFVYIDHIVPEILPYTIDHPFCTETTGTITFESQPGSEYSFDGGATFQTSPVSPPLIPGYYVLQVRDGADCESQISYAYISEATGIPSAPSGNDIQNFCIHNNPTVSFLQASGQNIRWYEAGNPSELSPTTPLHSGLYHATQTTDLGCESPVSLSVLVSVGPYSIPVQDYSTDVCDAQNNGSENVDLSDFNPNFIPDPENHTFSYHTSFAGADAFLSFDAIPGFSSYAVSGLHTIYVRVTAANGCWGVSRLDLNLVPVPVNAMPVHYILCENYDVTLTAEPGFDHYLWSTGETTQAITVTTDGNYTVTVTDDHNNTSCTSTTNVLVQLSNPATITGFETYDWTQNNNSFTVNATGLGDYEYSLDNLLFQDSPTFHPMMAGEYKVYVRDKNRCGTVSEFVQLLMYPLFFTPNGDAINDNWQIKFSWTEPDMTIHIFDRYGKLLKQFSPNGPGWDGTYHGKPMPSDDYWFLVERERGTYRGHFSLKR